MCSDPIIMFITLFHEPLMHFYIELCKISLITLDVCCSIEYLYADENAKLIDMLICNYRNHLHD